MKGGGRSCAKLHVLHHTIVLIVFQNEPLSHRQGDGSDIMQAAGASH